jgi:uncharacterized membrane protein SirB2
VIEFYPQIRWLHIMLALLSGMLFTLRGIGVLCKHGELANTVPVRYLSYTIDIALLTAALMLLTMLRLSVLETDWLLAKIVLLLCYIVLGSFALRRAPTRHAKAVCFVLALAIYAVMLGIARAHDARGWLLLGA